MDFDCLASMVGAARLYPNAEIFLQPTAEGPVREFLNLYREHFNFRRYKDFESCEVDTLIVLETASRDRLGPYVEALDSADKVILYDHHDLDDLDFTPDEVHDDEVGALTTLMLEIIRDQGIELTEEEATLFLLALHQETGSFQFGSTTSRDYEAGRILLENGANLDIVQKFSHRPLSAEQIDLLNDLLENSKKMLVNEVPITIATAVRSDYIPEIALLTHKIQDAQNAQFVLVLVELGDRVQMVLRNRYDHLDVGAIARQFNGGGHARAASASFVGRNLDEVREEVIDCLNDEISARETASDLMSSPVHSISPDTTVEEAHELMLRLGHHGLPITDSDNELMGIITRTDVDKAINHELTHAPVKGFMSPEVVTVSPEAGVERLQTMLTSEQIGRLPVVDDGRLVGIVTRTDVIKNIHRRETGADYDQDFAPEANYRSVPDVTEDMEDLFESDWITRFREWGNLAHDLDDQLYLVGGCVRDILLERDIKDLDFLLEDDAIEFARELADVKGLSLSSHEKFKTAVMELPNGDHVDFATARSEYYSHPSALPEVDVENASIVQDLKRRDFTINAMAINLCPDTFGKLIDLYGGYRDLRNGVIRILYAMSFVDDPTRIFRAVRFSNRLDFSIEKRTKEQMESAVSEARFDEISGERIRYELELIFLEDDAWDILSELDGLSVLNQIHPEIDLGSRHETWFEQAHDQIEDFDPEDSDLVYYCLMFESLSSNAIRETSTRLNFSRRYRQVLEKNSKFEKFRKRLEDADRPSEIYRACDSIGSYELMIARLIIEERPITEKLSEYLEDLEQVEPLVDGDILTDWGMQPGPKMGDVLEELFDYQLDNQIRSLPPLKEYYNSKLMDQSKSVTGENE